MIFLGFFIKTRLETEMDCAKKFYVYTILVVFFLFWLYTIIQYNLTIDPQFYIIAMNNLTNRMLQNVTSVKYINKQSLQWQANSLLDWELIILTGVNSTSNNLLDQNQNQKY